MLAFDDNAHKFTVTAQSPRLGLEFGAKMFFTPLTGGLPVDAIEATFTAGQGAFNNVLVPPALLFSAEAIALVPKGADGQGGARFRRNFEFGFVQGTSWPSVHLEYWGKTKADGRSIVHIDMPATMEVDTDPAIVPWTRVGASRFQVAQVGSPTSDPLRFKVTADFSDHPMLIFPHTIGTPALKRFVRSVSFTRSFRTIFSVLDKSDGSFTAISATEWRIPFDHIVTYTNGGTTRTVQNKVGAPNFPRGGSPSVVDRQDRDILAKAKARTPLVTQSLIDARLKSGVSRSETDNTPNDDFDSSFFS